jgi:protein-S-isoprenylcysteine O-methyltransferase Ste14
MSIGRSSVKPLLGFCLFVAAWLAIAGRVDWWQGWSVLASCTVYVAAFGWHLARTNPGLMRERIRPGGSVAAWDRRIMAVYSWVLVLMLVISALDGGRFAWSNVPLGWQVLGWLLLVTAGAIVWQAASSNPYLSSWARLQEDRSQVVIRDGPYRLVRHPMYLAIMVALAGMPLALGSWWALIPAVTNIGLFIYRTAREDEMLLGGLPGYAEYSQTVKYRLIPGVW